MQKNNSLIGCLGYFGAALLIFLVLGIGLGISQCRYEAKEELEFSTQLEDQYPAYIQIKSIIPEYSITEGYNGYISDVVCRCTTTSGETVWLYISTYKYEEYIDSEASFGTGILGGSSFETVDFADGTIIHGKVRDAEELCDGLSRKTNKTVLYFESIEVKQP